MPSYLATSNNDAIETAEQVLLDSTQTIAGVEDVLVDGQSVVRDNVAHIDLSGKQNKLTITQDLTLDGAELGVNKEKIQEKLSAGNNIEIIDNVISAKAVQPNIDSIAVNGTELIPDENKQVNITIDKATVDLTNVDNTSDINKPVSTAQQAAIDAVADKLNKDLITTVSTELVGDTLNLNIVKENLSTGATAADSAKIISTATQDSAGLMSSSDVKALADITSRVSRLEGKTTRLLYTASTNPTKEQIDEFVKGLGYTDYEGVAVVVKDTYHIWHYYANDNIGWRDDGQDTVSTFTNDVPGLIKGAGETDGKVYAETDGTGSVYGWDALKAQVEENKNNLANKADVSSLNSKLDSVTSTTTANQAYTKKADGTQKMENIYATAEPNSIAYRDENGRLKAADGDADDDVLTRGQYNTYITAAVSGLEHTDNKVSAIEGEGSDVQYPSTKALVDYVAAIEPYHITLTGYTGTVTQEQYDKLKADDRSYIYFTDNGVIAVKVINWDTGLYYNVITGASQFRLYIKTDLTYSMSVVDVELLINKVKTITGAGTDTEYPTTKAVVDYTATAIEAGVSGCERTDNKVTAITDEGSDVQYPSTSAVVKYIKANAPSAYHIELTGDSGTITTEQYNALLADNDSYILHTVGVAVMRFARAVKVEGAQTGLQYQKFIGGIARTISIEASGAWTKTETTYQSTNKLSTTLNSSSTDSQYPSAKATYDADQATLTAAKAYADSLVGDINTALQTLDTGTGV